MAKAVKKKKVNPTNEITVKTNLTPDQLLKLALNTSIKKSKTNKK